MTHADGAGPAVHQPANLGLLGWPIWKTKYPAYMVFCSVLSHTLGVGINSPVALCTNLTSLSGSVPLRRKPQRTPEYKIRIRKAEMNVEMRVMN